MTELAKELGITRKTLYVRRDKGMPVHDIDLCREWIACNQSPKTTNKNLANQKAKGDTPRKEERAQKLEKKADELKVDLQKVSSMLSSEESAGIEIGEKVIDEQMLFLQEQMDETRGNDLASYANHVRLFISLIKEKLAIQKDIHKILSENQKLIDFEVHAEMMKEQADFFVTETGRISDIATAHLTGEAKKKTIAVVNAEVDRIKNKLYDYVPED